MLLPFSSPSSFHRLYLNLLIHSLHVELWKIISRCRRRYHKEQGQRRGRSNTEKESKSSLCHPGQLTYLLVYIRTGPGPSAYNCKRTNYPIYKYGAKLKSKLYTDISTQIEEWIFPTWKLMFLITVAILLKCRFEHYSWILIC